MNGRILSWPAAGTPVTALDGPAAVALAEMLAPVLRRRAQRGEGLSATEAAAVRSVLTGAREWSIGAAIALASDLGSEIDNPATSGGTLWCTTAEASRKLGVSQRAVRAACKRGDLQSRQATARGPWLVAEEGVARYVAKRTARRT